MSRASLVMVYHREPFEEHKVRGRTEMREHKSPNGIIPTLRGVFRQGEDGLWVAWKRSKDPENPEFDCDVSVDYQGSHIDVHRVPLPKDTVETFYYKFSKEALWPVIFSSPTKAHFDEAQWKTFVEVNQRFADAVVERAEPDATVWVHDYNLWLVPAMLRRRMPGARIGFFHHTPFPAADMFAVLPWRERIVESLLSCDLVGFHVPHYANSFADVAQNLFGAEVLRRNQVSSRFLSAGSALSTPKMVEELRFGDRRIRLGAFPVGIDTDRIDEIRATSEHAERVANIRKEMGDRRVLLSVERLDYIKGPVEKLLAYERLLENHPEYRETVTFVNVVTPPADQISVYKSVRGQVDNLVGRINGRFATLNWTPVRYFYKPLPYEHVVSWYEAASIAWVSPLRDGLNLVGKEFVAANPDADKVLIMSEFAGAQVELQYSVTVNPYSPRSMDRGLRIALEMPEDARRIRMNKMNGIVRKHTVQRWAGDFLDGLGDDRRLRATA